MQSPKSHAQLLLNRCSFRLVSIAARTIKGVLVTSELLCMPVPAAGRTNERCTYYVSTSLYASPSRWANDERCTYYICTSLYAGPTAGRTMKGVLTISVLLPVPVAGRMKCVLITSVLLCMPVPAAGRSIKDVLNYISTSASPSRWTNDERCT